MCADQKVNEDVDLVRQKALGLFGFLKEIVQIRSTVIRDNSDFLDVLWLSSVPQEDGCYCSGWPNNKDAEDNVWLEVKKQNLPKIPDVPDACKSWVNQPTLRKLDEKPTLLESILNPDWREKNLSVNEIVEDADVVQEQEPPQYLLLDDFPDVKFAWESYVDRNWTSWARDYKKKKVVQDIYARLFSMYQQQKSLGESYEVVLGLGLLNWKTRKEQNVSRHIISAQIDLDFNPNQGSITVRPSVEGAKLQFEQDMLEPDERPMLKIYLEQQERLKDISNDIWHNELMHAILRSWVQALHSSGTYSDDWSETRAFSNDPKMFFAPALILRKRTTRGYIKFIEDILAQIKADSGPIPDTVKLYVDIQEGNQAIGKSIYEGVETPPGDEPSREKELPDTEVYFPLASNDEQREIIRKLGKRLGVLVQGPPGTGKSHTIANLMCHLLAQGKRVLVTSQSARALKVLMNKLPAKIRPLCVNLLGRGLADVQSMENSVGEINRRHNNWNKSRSEEIAKNHQTMLYETKKRLQEIDFRMRELRESEVRTYTIADGIYEGTAQAIARQVADGEEQYGWLQDEIDLKAEQPLDDGEFQNLIRLLRLLTSEKVCDLKKSKIELASVPAPEQFVEMVHRKKKYKERADKVSDQIEILHLVNDLKKLPKDIREEAINTLNKFNRCRQEALRRPLAWLCEAVNQMLGEQDSPLKELEISTKGLLEGLKDKARESDDVEIKWPNDIDLVKVKADSEDLCGHLKNGGKLGWAAFRAKVVKRTLYITEQFQVDGRACDKPELLEKLIACIGVELRLRKLDQAWSSKIEPSNGTRFHRAAVYAEQYEALLVVLELENVMHEVREIISRLEGITLPKLYDEKEVEALLDALESVRAIDELKAMEEGFEKLYTNVAAIVATDNHHPIMSDFLEAISKSDWKLWGECYQVLVKLEEIRIEYETLNNLCEKVREALPNTLEEINNSFAEEYWDKRAREFNKAWKWSKGEAWLDEYSSQHDEYDLQKDYDHQQKRAVRIIEELAAEKAWSHCFSRMTEKQRQHLMAWSVSIKKLGKGTGKYAEKHRRDAEMNLRECQDAIPSWIMPIYRVVDTVKPEPGIFDVVIIDEASQCGSEALLLQYIAKQCIIVGDEEQIAPEAVGVQRNQVHLLIEQFLTDVPIKDSFDIESSLFTHAKIRYKDKVVLREHFRCVPEIIQFSNNLCYAPHGASLIPLREYPPNRLDPLKTQHVPEGFRESNGQNVLNRPEADKLVEAIVACHQDKKYLRKSFGVITLQGHAQSKYIEKKLIEDLGPEIMEERGIICGQAYDFQGDERDVIFISMVAATNERIGVLTKETDKRRFNVAASRAADQVWLFHSVTLEELNPMDFRYKLLSYYLNPQVQSLDLDGIDLEQLKRSRRNTEPPEPFDSWFEVDVYCQLVEKGYRVIPQYRVANYKIDLVIEGMKGRLAVECDGDQWHGPEVYEQDMARQRVLERAKWKFWRVRGSGYYRDPMQAMEPLWQKLEEMHIYPRGFQEPSSTPSPTTPAEQVEESVPEVALVEPDEKEEKTNDAPEKLSVSNRSELDAFCGRQDNLKKLTPPISRSIVIKILQDEPSKGKDLLPQDAVKALGYTCRRGDRRKLEKKIQRAISDLVRFGTLEEYSTNKRKRVRINKSNTLFDV